MPRAVPLQVAAAGCCEMFVLWSFVAAAAGCLCRSAVQTRKKIYIKKLPTNTIPFAISGLCWLIYFCVTPPTLCGECGLRNLSERLGKFA